jgi:argininosuccinate lyase
MAQAKKSLGLNITFVTSDLNFYTRGKPIAETMLASVNRIVEIQDSGTFSNFKNDIDRLNVEIPISAFMTFSEYHIAPCSEAASFLGVPHLSPAACRVSRNKCLLRELLRLQGVPQPDYVLVESVEDATLFSEKMGFPLVVKPVDGTGSLNTRIVNSQKDLEDHISTLRNTKTYGRSTLTKPYFLMEEYLEGELFSVEVITQNNKHHVLGITDRELAGHPYFVEVGASFPVHLENEAQVIETCLKALDALGVDFGPTHTELICTRQGPKIVEINPRLVGGVVPEMIDRTLNTQIMIEVIQMHLGKEARLDYKSDGVSSCYFFNTEKSGVLKNIVLSPNVNHKNVVSWKVNKEPGQTISGLKSNFDWLGYIITHCKDQSSAKRLCAQIANETRFLINTEPSL